MRCAFHILLSCLLLLIPALSANPDDPAEEAAERIRPGVSQVDRQLAKDLLSGLGAEALPHVEDMALSTDPIQRRAAAEILGNQRAGTEKFLPLLEDPDYSVRKAALEGIQNSEDGRLAFDRMHSLLNDSFWPVRRAAIRALAAHPLPGTADALLEALKDPEPLVRTAALRFLEELDEDVPLEALMNASEELSPGEFRAFLKACLPLVRESNVRYFKEVAELTKGSGMGTAALYVYAAHTREVPDAWLSVLINQALGADEDSREAAAALLSVAGEQVIDSVLSHLKKVGREGAFEPRGLVHLLTSVLEEKAFTPLADWILDGSLPMDARSVCLEGLVVKGVKEGAVTLVRIFPALEDRLKSKAVEITISLVTGPQARVITPMLESALGLPDPGIRRKAYSALCLLEEPPVEELGRLFREEDDPDLRAAFARNLVNAGEGRHRHIVAEVLFEEVAEGGPAALAAASELYKVSDENLAIRAVESLQNLLERSNTAAERKALLMALIHLGREEADRVVADEMERIARGGESRDLEYLIVHLDSIRGEFTRALLHRLFPEAEPSLKEKILRTLIRRADPKAAEWIGEVFSWARLSYRRSILEDLAVSGLSEACRDLLKSILLVEKEPDLLATALDAAPLSLLSEVDERLIGLAGLGPELGLDTMESILNAIARVGRPEGMAFLRAMVRDFFENKGEEVRARDDRADADMALTAALSLARVHDSEAPAFLAGFLFHRARASRKRDILSEWDAESGGGKEGKTHTLERNALRGLLYFDDETVENAVIREMEDLEKDGRLFQCGDAVFCTLSRILFFDPLVNGRCPCLATRLAALTLTCAPANSPSDFRVHLLQADQAAAAGDHEKAAESLARAYHVMKYYRLAREVVRDHLYDPDPFAGYFPKAHLASEMYAERARAYEGKGMTEKAAKAWEQARLRSPFLRGLN